MSAGSKTFPRYIYDYLLLSLQTAQHKGWQETSPGDGPECLGCSCHLSTTLVHDPIDFVGF